MGSKMSKKFKTTTYVVNIEEDQDGGEFKEMNDEKLKTDEIIDDPFFLNRPHPLLIPHIVETVFENIFPSSRHIPELRACRLVCSRWNELATKMYRNQNEDLVFGETGYGADSKRMRKFLSDVEDSFDNPIQTYRFDPGFFTQKNASLFKTFLYSCSQWIVTLKLWFDNESNLRFSKRCYPDLKLDSLEYLFFGCVNHRGTCSFERMELTYILEALLNSTNNLKRFCFSFPPKDIKSQQAMIKRFGDLVTQKCPKTVKNLKLEMKLTNAQVQYLTDVGLSLDTLHCDFRGSSLSSQALHDLLSQQKSTLQEMRLLDSEIKYCYELKFPRFEKLSVLEIQGGTIATPFSYKEQFPVLERLLLFGWENAKSSKSMLESSTPCHSLSQLELPYKIKDQHLIHLAAKCFPNLKKLEITPTHEGMNVLANVFANLTQLEELEITFPFIIDVELNVDPVFTGITLDDCELISSSKEDIHAVNFKDLQKSPSIANLSKLKKLTILDHSNEIRLTDITAFFGLLRLQNLETLEMGKFNISEHIFQSLKEKVRVSENFDSDSSSWGDDSSEEFDDESANEIITSSSEQDLSDNDK